MVRVVLLCILAAGCGGIRHGGPVEGGNDAGGEGGSAHGSGGEGGSVHGAGGSPPQCVGEAPELCVWNCDQDPRPATCVGGEWRCEEGFFDRAECAANPCLGTSMECCRGETVEAPLCVDHSPRCAPGTDVRVRPTCGGCEVTGCGPEEYCRFDGCSMTQGVCEPRPQSCDATGAPVCTCDATFAPSPCDAARAGKSLGSSCPILDTQYYCRSRTCEKGTELCIMAELPEGGDVPECAPLPTGCDPASCECLQEAVPGRPCECGMGADGPFLYCMFE